MKLRLTDMAIKKLPNPEHGQVTHWDELTPGFGLRCSVKSKSFVVMYGEKRQLKTLGRYPTMSLSGGRTAAKRFFVHFNEGLFTPKVPSVTFQAARNRFLQDAAGRNKPRTVADYTRLLNKHFHFEDELRDITRQQIMRFVSGLVETPSEQSHAYVAIRTMMNWCVRHGLIEHSVVPAIKQRSNPRKRVLSNIELKKIYMRAIFLGYEGRKRRDPPTWLPFPRRISNFRATEGTETDVTNYER